MPKWEEFLGFFEKYTNGFSKLGITFLAVDIIIVIALLIFTIKVLKIKLKIWKTLIFVLFIIILYGVTYLCDFKISFSILKTIGFWGIGILVILYSQELRHTLENNFHNSGISSVYSSEEEKSRVVNLLVESAAYLSERKIGALICIERADSLESFIEKSIKIKGELSKELLTSLFFTGSATHDGAVIVRKNSIMCAGAYLPATDNYDLPKTYGTRHRAAIGLSEKYDAFTIVVSEETGNIAVTLRGKIHERQTIDELREKLSENLLQK